MFFGYFVGLAVYTLIVRVEDVVRADGAIATAANVEEARAALARSIGHLGSRSTRAEAHGRT
ncbi:MAG: hypothetical protein ABJE66_08590 [Deltaproteobacteria bacterium]